MLSFTKKTNPDQQVFKCFLVGDLTDTFIHPKDTSSKLTLETGKKAFLDWLMSPDDKINGGKKNNLDYNKGVQAFTILSTVLPRLGGPIR
jgi:hypothetical protein